MKKYVFTLSMLVMLAFASSLSAGICASTTDCTLHFTQGNTSSGFGTADFGTLRLQLDTTTHVATLTVDLSSGFFSIDTGFPGAFGFADSLGGGLTGGGLPSGYSGFLSHATNDLHFDGFGFANNAAATSAPAAGDAAALNVVSFTVSKSTLTDVNQLLNLFSPAGGDGAVYFVADVINRNTSGPGAGLTGLIGITGSDPVVPEPTTYLGLLIPGLAAMAFVAERRRRKTENVA